ncbi:hypothetical protein [Vibrio phage JSF13]|nr:hypothetical protein [Vibrio phage JSF4]ASV41391.1 hypothetical protein [Vibrio phage JSF5]ASV41626.1 hypothetical protein [Vibrio phage JSF6]ASV41640.1 hypothetical protein [Vibrio phage JSF1]ASV42008.1 hypothetical protein [Vibrio phage JSF2]ASV42287.1 hypothetical protein [Vibrio phage JSF13]ASV42367.1 hypothetical protein [Vibrio phage JSF14]ASV42582.1 hypothetical protein [Vibrio phage JSF17]
MLEPHKASDRILDSDVLANPKNSEDMLTISSEDSNVE